MMNYISAPINFVPAKDVIIPERSIDDPVAMMDNLIEMIILTPKGTFNADPDFGFEYWDPTVADVSAMQYNAGSNIDEYSRRGIKEKCEADMAECVKAYSPACLRVKDVVVEMNLKDDKMRLIGGGKLYTHREVCVVVSAKIDDGMGTMRDYSRKITFMVEPVMRRTYG